MKSSLLMICVLSALCLVATVSANAAPWVKDGGVSDGGGDFIGASEVSPEEISTKVAKLSPWVVSWLNKKQAEFKQLEPAEKAASDFVKVFPENDKDILELVKTGSVEVRLQGPCFDKNGKPKDASIYAKKENQICLSALLLSQKLDKNNFEKEIAALMIHEVSHLLGTTEEEATAIQKIALQDFGSVSLAETKRKLASLLDGPQGGVLLKTYGPLQSWQQDPQRNTSARDLLYWNQQWGQVASELTDSERGLLQYVPMTSLAAFPAYNYKIAVLVAYYQAHDKNLDPETRQEFQDRLDETFAQGDSLTVRQLIQDREGWDPGPDYDRVVINKPVTWADQAKAMNDLVIYLKGLEQDVRILSQSRFVIEN